MQSAGGASLVVVILLILPTSLWAADGWYLLVPPRSQYNERADFFGNIALDLTTFHQIIGIHDR